MRSLVSLMLIGLITLCPILCGAEETDHGTHRHATPSGPAQGPASPTHCPDEADNCICQGAVQASDVRIPGGDAVGLCQLLDAILPTPSHPIAHLTRDGSPTGLAGWGDALAVRSVLQNFRC